MRNKSLGKAIVLVVFAVLASLLSQRLHLANFSSHHSASIQRGVAKNLVDGEYLVSRVIDGDTIELQNGERVRYIGMDTPETVDPNKPVQCFGEEASAHNKELVEGKYVRLLKDVSEADKYGRLLRYVYISDDFINLDLVKDGYARVSTLPPDMAHSKDFVSAEKTARAENLGLWAKCSSN